MKKSAPRRPRPSVASAIKRRASPLQTVAADLLAERSDKAVAALRDDLKSTDKIVRLRAVHLLSRINSRGSRAELNAILQNKDEDAAVKGVAEFALKRLDAKHDA